MTVPTVLFIAGDPSGDQHAARVVRALAISDPSIKCTGIGGPAMVAAGFIPLMPFEPFNRMGFLEVLLHLPFFLHASRIIKSFLRRTMPACVVCVDYSGFNIPIMKAAHTLNIPVVWYIAPMVWAWKKKRAEVLARFASHICCIFPFEVPYFKPYTENVHFVGNPVVEEFRINNVQTARKTVTAEHPVLALVPGSRYQEVTKNLPSMLGAFRLLKEKYPGLKAMISRYHGIPETVYGQIKKGIDVELFSGPLSELLKKSDVAIVTSGTATLEAALIGIPHVIVYKTSPVTYAIFKHFVTISYIGLPNIIADDCIAPECIQEYVTNEELCRKTEPFLTDAVLYQKTVERLLHIRDMLGSIQPSTFVAELVQKCMKESLNKLNMPQTD